MQKTNNRELEDALDLIEQKFQAGVITAEQYRVFVGNAEKKYTPVYDLREAEN